MNRSTFKKIENALDKSTFIINSLLLKASQNEGQLDEEDRLEIYKHMEILEKSYLSADDIYRLWEQCGFICRELGSRIQTILKDPEGTLDIEPNFTKYFIKDQSTLKEEIKTD